MNGTVWVRSCGIRSVPCRRRLHLRRARGRAGRRGVAARRLRPDRPVPDHLPDHRGLINQEAQVLDATDNLYIASGDSSTRRLYIETASKASGWTDWAIRYTSSAVYYSDPLIDHQRLKSLGVMSIFAPRYGGGQIDVKDWRSQRLGGRRHGGTSQQDNQHGNASIATAVLASIPATLLLIVAQRYVTAGGDRRQGLTDPAQKTGRTP
ncbi:hypothetical protein BJ973_000145 [Actinoplanes tereljensis]|uniref:Uncharacterized protein n=1 Tax=Paractinoplanes tereljensis TaxID=571912 RepID=A0A919TZ24_9ACTN|nr:hypothetical protein [Actinoplanes tereljensis]GIF26764.1 hypothetical protein Ate02nite_94940 [Actinoplanes tereljensis]